jgi:hypothetical protein
MKLLIAAVILATVTTTSAQQMQPFEPSLNNDTPTVVTQYDKTTGEIAGTTTIVDGKAYLRDKNGKHYATLIIDKDGTRRMVDPQGQPIDAAKIREYLEEVK